jgi:Tol biopolymer transport system component
MSVAAPAQSPAIVFERGGDLYAVALDASHTVRLTMTHGVETAPAVSADGRRIAFALAGDLWTMDVHGANRTRLTRGGEDTSPAWSPDGGEIYFIRYASGPDGPCGSIFRVGSDGRELRRIAVAPHFHSYEQPAVSPDGRRIAFSDWNGCSGGTSSPRLRVIDASGRPTSDLARLPRNGYYPDPEHGASAWSPDGRRLALVLNGRLAIVNRDGSGVRAIAPKLRVDDAYARPAWSRDGSWLAIVDRRGDLYAIHPDGSALRRVARTGSGADAPAWLPRLTVP